MPSKALLQVSVIILLLGLSTAAVVPGQQEYCVAPVVNQPPCEDKMCPCAGHSPCHTLQYYVENSNFTSNSTFCFLQGEHTLDDVVDISSIVNLSLVGVSRDSTTVRCNSSSAGFYIQNFVQFRVKGLSFLYCGVAQVDVQAYHGAFILSIGSGLDFDGVTVSNSSGYGLAAFAVQGISTISNSMFSFNRAATSYCGGNVMFLYSSCSEPCHLQIDNSEFLNGNETHMEFMYSGTGGLTVLLNCAGVNVSITNSILDHNHGYFGGNLYIHFILFTGNFVRLSNVTASNGSGDRGTGIFIVVDVNLPINDHTSCGSGSLHTPHYLMEMVDVSMVDNTGFAALYFEDRGNYQFGCAVQYALIKDTAITGTHMDIGGTWYGGTTARLSSNKPYSNKFSVFETIQATFQNVTFSGSRAAFYTVEWQTSMIHFQMVANVTLIDCTFENNEQPVISAMTTNMYFQGNHTFRNNSGYYGTGITLLQNSYLFLKQDTHILFADNYANSVGAALYVDVGLPVPAMCFFQVEIGPSSDPVGNIKVDFVNNTANYAGSSVYGPILNCKTMQGKNSGWDVFWKIFNVTNTESDPSAITTNPFAVCLCDSGRHLPNCSIPNRTIRTYPGETFTLRLAVVGHDLSGAVPGAIQALFKDSGSPGARFGPLQDSQNQNNAHCSDFNYSIFSTDKSVSFYLSAHHLFFAPYYFLTPVSIIVLLRDCPLGFVLSKATGECVCDPVISRDDVHCYISNQSILRPANTWIGFLGGPYDGNESSNESGVIFHSYCQYGHCLDQSVVLDAGDPDVQCTRNRTGLLCGRCKDGYSLTLGSGSCSKCSNYFLFLLVPFAISGLVLVAFLFLLNLTVTEGSINGLIFYANIVAMSVNTGTSCRLCIFVAWLNLDFGIDTCFFDGMDAYVETWLQFVFPLYLWAIILAIVVVCNKFAVGGKNGVQVLATLLLLSYTKLQRAVVAILTFTHLTYPNGTVSHVWLYDANIEFLKGKHLALYVTGILVLVVLIVPYTLGLALFQYLLALSSHRAFWWVNRLKPVFDSYAGPYKDRFRVWTGLLLVVRTFLIILFSLDITDSPDINNFAVLIMSLVLLMIMAGSRGIYKKWSYDVLEAFFYLQLGVFSSSMMYASSHNSGYLPVAVDVSIGMVLLAFLVIIGYHGFYWLSGLCKDLCRCKDCVITAAPEEVEPLLYHDREHLVPVLAAS